MLKADDGEDGVDCNGGDLKMRKGGLLMVYIVSQLDILSVEGKKRSLALKHTTETKK